MSYYDLLRQALNKELATAGRVQRAGARGGYNQAYGQGLTQSGGLATANEAIARQEGAEASGINAYVTALEEERAREDRMWKEQQKANKLNTILGIGGMVAPMVAPVVGKGLGALFKGGGPGVQGQGSSPALGPMPQVNLAGIREAGGNVVGNMMGAQTNLALDPWSMRMMRMWRLGGGWSPYRRTM